MIVSFLQVDMAFYLSCSRDKLVLNLLLYFIRQKRQRHRTERIRGAELRYLPNLVPVNPIWVWSLIIGCFRAALIGSHTASVYSLFSKVRPGERILDTFVRRQRRQRAQGPIHPSPCSSQKYLYQYVPDSTATSTKSLKQQIPLRKNEQDVYQWIEGHRAGAYGSGLPGHCVVQDTKEDSYRVYLSLGVKAAMF